MLMSRKILLGFVFFISLIPEIGFSQDSLAITLDSSKVYFFQNDFELKGARFISQIDTLITNVEKYDPIYKPGNYYASLGNIGLAHQNQIMHSRINSGFNYGIHSFDKYMFHNDSIYYYWVGKPYTHLKYIMGPKKEQNLYIDHSQNVASWFTLGLKFRYINSPGYYINQKSDDKNFVMKTRFQTRNYRYIVLASYMHNKLKVEDNGGIVYDSVFEGNTKSSRNSINVNLQTANNRIIQNGFYVKQIFNLSKNNRFQETDSSNFKAGIFNPGTISLSSHLLQTSFNYKQELSDSAFYVLLRDTLPTNDSTHLFGIENQLAWTNADNIRRQKIVFFFALKHLYTEISGFESKRIFNQLIPKAGISFFPLQKLQFDFYADFVTGNSNVGDFNLFGKASWNTGFGALSFKSNFANKSIDWFYQNYTSNHFIWENNFDQQLYLINTAEYNYKRFTAGVEVTNISDFMYMDTLGIPAQIKDGQDVLRIYARKLFVVKNWRFDIQGIYQKVSRDGILRLPDLIGDLSIYYTKDLFKQAAILQTGIDTRYNTSYYADAYMPATRSFYLQNKKKVGDYIYADAFVTLQIKRARLFFKYQNLGSLAKDYRYYTVPSYPMQDHGYRFGLSWMFYD
jgi:hypothetical protein